MIFSLCFGTFPFHCFFSQEEVLRLSSDVQAADPVEPSQGALRQDGGGQRGQGRHHTKEFHSERTQGSLWTILRQICQKDLN